MQWALLESADATFIAFRGTANPMDGLIDISVQPCYFVEHELPVHSGMINSLRSRAHKVVDIIQEKLAASSTSNAPSRINTPTVP